MASENVDDNFFAFPGSMLETFASVHGVNTPSGCGRACAMMHEARANMSFAAHNFLPIYRRALGSEPHFVCPACAPQAGAGPMYCMLRFKPSGPLRRDPADCAKVGGACLLRDVQRLISAMHANAAHDRHRVNNSCSVAAAADALFCDD